MMRFEIKPLTPSFGAELAGIDLSVRLDKEVIFNIREAFLEYGVIFFRNQKLTPDSQMRFANYFGELLEYPFVDGLKKFPFVIPVLKRKYEEVNFGGIWHSDTAYLPEPPMGTILYAKKLPPIGGDTLFADMYKAYETLSGGMKKILRGMRAVNSAANKKVSQTRVDRMRESKKDMSNFSLENIHPVIRTHPETGRSALYVNKAHTTRFDGMTAEESLPILNYLFRHQIRQEFICRFQWSEGAIAFWDNRCTQHYPLNDYHGFSRLLHRVTLKGERPF